MIVSSVLCGTLVGWGGVGGDCGVKVEGWIGVGECEDCVGASGSQGYNQRVQKTTRKFKKEKSCYCMRLEGIEGRRTI